MKVNFASQTEYNFANNAHFKKTFSDKKMFR